MCKTSSATRHICGHYGVARLERETCGEPFCTNPEIQWYEIANENLCPDCKELDENSESQGVYEVVSKWAVQHWGRMSVVLFFWGIWAQVWKLEGWSKIVLGLLVWEIWKKRRVIVGWLVECSISVWGVWAEVWKWEGWGMILFVLFLWGVWAEVWPWEGWGKMLFFLFLWGVWNKWREIVEWLVRWSISVWG